MQVIDYKAHEPLPAYLAGRFGGEAGEPQQLQYILDCVGSDELFRRCHGYLHEDGAFITIVGGVGRNAIMRSKLLPAAFGGTPRRFEMLSLMPGGDTAREAAKWIEAGEFRDFPMDSEYPFDQVVEVMADSVVEVFY